MLINVSFEGCLYCVTLSLRRAWRPICQFLFFCLFAASKQTILFYNKDTRGELQKATFDSPQLKKIFHGSFHKVNAAAILCALHGPMYWIDTGCCMSVKSVSSVLIYTCVQWPGDIQMSRIAGIPDVMITGDMLVGGL